MGETNAEPVSVHGTVLSSLCTLTGVTPPPQDMPTLHGGMKARRKKHGKKEPRSDRPQPAYVLLYILCARRAVHGGTRVGAVVASDDRPGRAACWNYLPASRRQRLFVFLPSADVAFLEAKGNGPQGRTIGVHRNQPFGLLIGHRSHRTPCDQILIGSSEDGQIFPKELGRRQVVLVVERRRGPHADASHTEPCRLAIL